VLAQFHKNKPKHVLWGEGVFFGEGQSDRSRIRPFPAPSPPPPQLRAACEGVDAVIWCATPFSTPALTPWETLLQAVGVKTEKKPVPVDREGAPPPWDQVVVRGVCVRVGGSGDGVPLPPPSPFWMQATRCNPSRVLVSPPGDISDASLNSFWIHTHTNWCLTHLTVMTHKTKGIPSQSTAAMPLLAVIPAAQKAGI